MHNLQERQSDTTKENLQLSLCQKFFEWKKGKNCKEDLFKEIYKSKEDIFCLLEPIFQYTSKSDDKINKILNSTRFTFLVRIKDIESKNIIYFQIFNLEFDNIFQLVIPQKISDWIMPNYFKLGEIGIFSGLLGIFLKKSKRLVFLMDSYTKRKFFI